MPKYKHTVNIAAAPIVTVFDDRGDVVQTFMLPICLIIFLPARLWAAWLNLTLHASRFTFHASRFTLHASRFTLHASRLTLPASRFLSAAYNLLLGPGWREDLQFMSLALVSLFSPPSGRGWGRAAL